MTRPGVSLLLVLALVSGCRDARDETETPQAPPPALVEHGDEVAVALDSAAVSAIGLRTVSLTAISRAREIEVPAMVVDDPGATTIVRSGIGGRLRAADGHDWPRIGEALHSGDTIAQVGDALPLLVPRGGTVSRLLAQPGELLQPGQELLELVDYSTALVRVAWSGEPGQAPASLTLVPLNGGRGLHGTLLGSAPTGDALTLGPALLYRVNSDQLRPGVALLARIPDAQALRRGVMIPAAAVVQWDGLAWAFVQRAPGRYVRVLVPTDAPLEGGWLTERGFAAGDRVVTVAAGQLLAEEFRARIAVGEEVGE